jgi:hypothetical protein
MCGIPISVYRQWTFINFEAIPWSPGLNEEECSDSYTELTGLPHPFSLVTWRYFETLNPGVDIGSNWSRRFYVCQKPTTVTLVSFEEHFLHSSVFYLSIDCK